MKEQILSLNFAYYPLVTGQLDKYIFQDWEVEGGTIQLEVTSPVSGEISWSSSDEAIAVVAGGKVRALTTGIADITATDETGAQGKCRIQVIDNPGRLTPLLVQLNTNRLILNKTEGAALLPFLYPIDYFENGRLDKTFVWTSSNPDVVMVNHRGAVYAKDCGEAVITAVSKDVGRTVSCKVEVIKKSKQELYADPLEDMDGGSYQLQTGETMQLELPQEVSHQPVCWVSENPAVVSVDEQGMIQVHRSGNAHIYATFIRGGHMVEYAICGAPVKEALVSEVHISTKKVYAAKGQQAHVYAAVFPATLLEKQLVWESSDPSVCRIVKQHINLSGLDEIIFEAAGEGNAYLTGRLGEHKVTCEVTVSAKEIPVTELSIEPSKQMEYEAVEQLHPVCNEDATQKKLLWLSDDRTLVTVDREGCIKGYAAGTAHIYCIPESALSKEDLELYAKLSDMKKIAGDAKASAMLKELLEKNLYAVCEVEVKQECKSLSNLHIPAETITHESVCLLWNRSSLLDVPEFGHYDIYHNGAKLVQTTKIGYTVKHLQADAEHTFEVRAVGIDGQVLGSQSVTVCTKPAPSCVIDVTKAPYHAAGDGITTDTQAIQKAIDDCPQGGIVLLPEGYIFHSGALFLKSDMTFCVDGILFGSQDPDDYPPIVCRWEGYRKMRLTPENEAATTPVFEENVYSHASLLNVGVYDEGEAGALSPYTTHDVHICGRGMINGNGFSLSYNEGPCWYIFRKGLPVPQSPKRDQNIRGRVIALYNTKRAYLSDVTVAYGPSWTIHTVFCDSVTCDNLKVISMGNGRTGVMEGMLTLNGDGIDPDSSTNVNITGCYFTVGDDAVAIKSGRNRQGNELDKPSAYIRVTDCICKDAKGSFCIGREQAGGVHDVLFANLYVEHLTNFGLWIKSAPCRGGLVEDVVWKDCELKDTGGALQIEYNHGGDEDPALVLPHTRRITYENITFTGRNKFGIRILGVEGSPIHDVQFRGLRFQQFEAYKERKFVLTQCQDIRFTDAQLPDGYEWETE